MIVSCITKKPIPKGEEVKAQDLREGVFNLIKSDHPDFDKSCSISFEELNRYRRHYLTSLIEQERGELDIIDKDVLNSIKNNSVLSENIEDELEGALTIGQKLSDNIASFGGSWTFIIAFFTFIMIWISINIYLLTTKPFDPYPFILLNLILSCLAAIQAPIIMMSQNRTEKNRRTGREESTIIKSI
jgi:hypothetical protein